MTRIVIGQAMVVTISLLTSDEEEDQEDKQDESLIEEASSLTHGILSSPFFHYSN